MRKPVLSHPSSDAALDVEKASTSEGRPDGNIDGVLDRPGDRGSYSAPAHATTKLGEYLERFELQVKKFNVEARGIQRVTSEECHALSWKSYVQTFILWTSINLAAVNITLGMLAPAVYGLSFKDAAFCAVFGALVGSAAVAYIATWGPLSGNRTMIFARYTMGWWPSKLIVILNLIVLLGYSMIGLVVAGQILSAVSSNGSMSVVVGIVVVAICVWVVTTFGIQAFHSYERYAFIPPLIAISILYGVSGSKFDLTTPSTGDTRTVIGNRISFFSLCLAAAITYGGGAADYFVYYPITTPRLAIFAATLLALTITFTFTILSGIGLASAIPSTPSFSSAYDTSQGALLVTALDEPLGGFGRFLAVIIALTLVANGVPPTYVIGIDFQILGRGFALIPRLIWNTVAVVIYTVFALAGRDHLSEIFTNFLALMGYWVAIWIAITIEEQAIFRRRRGGYDWTAWNEREKLPLGIAALIAFLIGWAGAILCMAQVWYIGPIAARVGQYGADMGNYVGFSWAALVYPPLRWLELKKFAR